MQFDKFSESTSELRQGRIDYVEKRGKQLSEMISSRLDHGVSFLMLTNSGGAVATLSFMGAMKTIEPVPRAPAMLAIFLVGVVLVGLLRAIHYYRAAFLFAGWRDDVARAFTDSLGWTELLERDRLRSKNFVWADIVGWLAFLCFVMGAAIGYAGIFNFRA